MLASSECIDSYVDQSYPELIGAWFRLVEDMREKYNILDRDLYNIDETGFMMGIISLAMIVPCADRRRRGKEVQLGNREWVLTIAASIVRVGVSLRWILSVSSSSREESSCELVYSRRFSIRPEPPRS